MEIQRTQTTKTILEKKNKVQRVKLLNFHTYQKVIVIKTDIDIRTEVQIYATQYSSESDPHILVQVAITKYHRWVAYNQQKFISYGSRYQKSKTRVLAQQGSGEALLLGLQMSVFSLYPHVKREFSGVPLYKGTNLIYEGSTLIHEGERSILMT